MKTRWIILAVALQVLVLLFMAGEREWIVRAGRVIFLRTAPVDPRDAFRGDYVQLDYEISHVSPALLRDGLAGVTNTDSSRKEQKVYAVLREENGLAQLEFLTDRQPAGGLYLRGFLRHVWNWNDRAQIRYGLEAFFVEQKQGLELEAARRQGDIRIPLEMEVAVGRGGKSVLKGYRWSPLGIGLKIQTDTNNRPLSATVILCNVSSNALAIVDRPGNRSLFLEPDSIRSWTDNEWNWVHAAAPDSSIKDAHVVLLAPQAKHEMQVDLTAADWYIVKKDEPPRPVAEAGMGVFFRLVYRPPSAEACAGLEHADAIWHGELPSSAFGSQRID
ncbi:MAG: GDYXXLXY domain-containing protein [Lentisphaerota bacterium]